MILSVIVKSDKTCKVTSTSWTAVSWIAWASTPDHLQSLLVATKYLTVLQWYYTLFCNLLSQWAPTTEDQFEVHSL